MILCDTYGYEETVCDGPCNTKCYFCGAASCKECGELVRRKFKNRRLVRACFPCIIDRPEDILRLPENVAKREKI